MATTKHWTEEQSDAIYARGGTLLVSAAAGSGKTAVLVERVISLLTDPNNPSDADRLLVVTFTNAAASEMRERISKRIADMIEENPMDANLQRQQMLLQNSHISTIHSFCLDLLREHFEKIDIPSDFRIADQNEAQMLRNDVLSEILEKRYTAAMKRDDDGTFLDLSRLLSSGRDDSLLSETILKLYEFTRSLDDRENWLQNMAAMYDPEKKVAETIWGKIAEEYVKEAVESSISSHNRSLEDINSDEKLSKAYGPAFESDLAGFKNILETLKNGNWDKLLGEITNFDFIRLGTLRKFEDDDLKNRLKGERDTVKDTFKKLAKGIFCCDEAGFREDIEKLAPLVKTLISIVRELDEQFYASKLKKGILDFSDLEQLTLKLLCTKKDGKITFTDTAREVSKSFDEILVDEYQDTNPAQDLIFHAVSKDGKNLFMVGDVKQSIYSFRQARPEIFTENAKNCVPYKNGGFPAKIILGKNFRSRKGVTEAVNFFFNRLMSEQYGGVEYDENERLIAGAEYTETNETGFEFHVLDTQNFAGEEDSTEIEANYIARKIKSLIEGGFEVDDKGTKRKATYRDFCILMRSTTGKAETYTRALEEENIPVYADIGSGYLGAYEVMVMISFLRILDNPLQDVPLLSVLLSPVFGFTPDDVAEIRIENRKNSLYLALLELSKSGDTRFDNFLALLEKLRSLAAVLTADRLILRIYDETGLLNIFEAMPNGEMRKANLRLLLDYARAYESAGWRGLAGFIRFIDRIDKQRADLAPAAGISENADVVRIMTIHKSKGLEFPVCFLANLSKPYNSEDTMGAALFHPTCGFGSIVRDDELNCRFTTIPREAVRLEAKKSMLSEELRILYVAMTRAREKLICVATYKNLKTPLARAAVIANGGGEKASPFEEMTALNPGELILSAALLHPSGTELRSLAGGTFRIIPDENKWTLKVTSIKTLPKKEEKQKEAETNEEFESEKEELKGKIEEKLSYKYPFAELSTIPSKVSVSELSHKVNGDFDANALRPSFLENEKLTPTEKGTALHAFMQYCSFAKINDEEEVKAEIERLKRDKFLTLMQSDAVDIERVVNFTKSPIFEDIKNADNVRREFRFNIEVDAKEVYPETEIADAKILLQGMADLVLEKDDNVIIIDYKTDRVSNIEELGERYKKQLDIYAVAVSRILDKSVSHKFIYSFYKSRELEV